MRGEGVDTTFHDLFAGFWKKYQETGQLDWATLEPEPWPRNLVAVYLVARSAQLSEGTRQGAILSGWKQMEEGRKERFWESAFREYRERDGSLDKWAGLPDVARGGEHDTLDFNDERIATAVDAIHSVLASRVAPT
jgi:hypothetical protein